MNPFANSRVMDSIKRAQRKADMSMFERALHGLDIDPDYVDAIVGDLTEERALRAECDGVFGARLWYIREIVRSAPHVIVTLLRHVG